VGFSENFFVNIFIVVINLSILKTFQILLRYLYRKKTAHLDTQEKF
jgi:hypothetical protein